MAIDLSKFRSSAEDDKKFDVAPFDKAAGRTKFNARLTRALKQFNKEQGLQGGKDFDLGHNGQLRFKPTLNGHAIHIDPASKGYFPVSAEQFPALITELSKAVDAGDFDDQIEAALTKGTFFGGSKVGNGKTAVLDTLTKVKQSAGRQFKVTKKSIDDIRKDLTDRGVLPEWIEHAIEGLTK